MIDSTVGFGAWESWCAGLLWKGQRRIYPDKRRIYVRIKTIRIFQEQVRHCLEYLSVPLPLIEVGTGPGRGSGESIISASARSRLRFVGRDFGEDKICLVPPNSLLDFEHYSPVALGIITCHARVCTISPSFPTSLHLPRNRTDQQSSLPTRYRTPIHCQMHLCNVKCRTCARRGLSLFLV